MSCHSAIFGWASEHLESDSRNLAGMFFTQLCTSVLHFPNVDSKYLLYFPPLLNQQEVVLTLHSHSVTSEAKTLRRKNSLPNRSRPRSRSLPLQQQLAVSTSENAKSRRRPSVRPSQDEISRCALPTSTKTWQLQEHTYWLLSDVHVKCVSKVLGQLSDSRTSYIAAVTISASANNFQSW